MSIIQFIVQFLGFGPFKTENKLNFVYDNSLQIVIEAYQKTTLLQNSGGKEDYTTSAVFFLFYHCFIVGQSPCVFSSLPWLHPFHSSITISSEFLQKNFPKSFKIVQRHYTFKCSEVMSRSHAYLQFFYFNCTVTFVI